jgi:hypothetical protein
MTASKQENFIKARLTNIGDGVLELTDDAVKFYTETGRFKKQRKIAREIPIADVENIERQGNDVVVTWKDTIETFTFKQPSQADAVFERINTDVTKSKVEPEDQVPVAEKQIDLTQITTNAMETAISLFGILKNLHGRVNWKLLENSYKQSEEMAERLATHDPNPLSLDVKPLSAAVQEHRAKETAEKTYEVLKALHDGFNALVSSVNAPEQIHPTPNEAKLQLQAVYVVNDMLLGAVVGDEKITEEGAELLRVLDDLAKLPGSKIDTNAVKDTIDKLGADKEKQESLVEDIRLTLEQQLKEPIPSEAESEQPKNDQTPQV